MAPVEEDGGIVGWHLVRQAHGTALHELQGECGESVTLLELLAHVSSHKLHMATCYSPMVLWRYYTPSSVRYKHLDSVLGQRLSWPGTLSHGLSPGARRPGQNVTRPPGPGGLRESDFVSASVKRRSYP